jgi:hypothetical protein
MTAPRFILLHSPLVGPLTWQAVAAELRRRGHAAEAPAWPRLSSVEGSFYEALPKELASALWDDKDPLILVAHSGAGGLVGPLANWLATVEGVILVDSIMPHPRRSWFDTAPAALRDQLRAGAQMGELPPWDEWWPPGALEKLIPDAGPREALVAELEPLPQAYFEETAPSDVYMGPAAYLQLSGAYDDEGELAGRYGWPRVRLPLHHLAMLTDPEPVAVALESLAARLSEAARG